MGRVYFFHDYPGEPVPETWQKGKTNLDFTEARDSEWQWHCLLYTSPSPRDRTRSRMPSSA